MQKRRSLNLKRPHTLPPLPDLYLSPLRPMDPLNPPDLFLAGSRLNSPAPRPNMPINSDDIYSASNGRPAIKVFEPITEKIDKRKLSLDLLSDTIARERNSLLDQFKKTNSLNVGDLESKNSVKQNARAKNYSRNNFPHIDGDLTKLLTSQKSLPLEEFENLNGTFNSKTFQIPNRYAPLKPIAQDKIEK